MFSVFCDLAYHKYKLKYFVLRVNTRRMNNEQNSVKQWHRKKESSQNEKKRPLHIRMKNSKACERNWCAEKAQSRNDHVYTAETEY